MIEEDTKAGFPALQQIQPVTTIHGGSNRGSYAIEDMIYDYAMWISPRFKVKVIRTFKAVQTQAAQAATIKTEVAALPWEQQRQGSKKTRNSFTKTLKEHEVSGYGFASCSNGIYRSLFGAAASQLKEQRGLTHPITHNFPQCSAVLLGQTQSQPFVGDRSIVFAHQESHRMFG